MIIDHTHKAYVDKQLLSPQNMWNGAYYYSKEIVANIIPNVDTDRNWITINVPAAGGFDHSIVFIHNNMHPEYYAWLKQYKDLILVCGIPETCEKVKFLGTPIYLPLSIDVAEVQQYKCEKLMDVAYVGRKPKRKGIEFPKNTVFLENMPRKMLLKKLAQYRYAFAVGRCALECIALDTKLLAYDPRFPDTDRWKLLDNRDAAIMLNDMLKEIDG